MGRATGTDPCVQVSGVLGSTGSAPSVVAGASVEPDDARAEGTPVDTHSEVALQRERRPPGDLHAARVWLFHPDGAPRPSR